MSRLDELLAELEALPDAAVRDRVREAIGEVLALHRGAIARMLELRTSERWVDDPVVAPLLVLHDLHPADLRARADGAIQRVTPALGEGGARARLLAVTDGRVAVDYAPPADSPATAHRLRALLHEALLEAVPDAAAIELIESGRELIDPSTLRRHA